MEKLKIGIMGGTFNPIHIGHLIIAEKAREHFNLNKVFFISTGKSPHKNDGEIISKIHRSRMVKMALSTNSNFEYCGIEVDSDEISYSYNTIKKLISIYNDIEFYYIMGEDSFMSIETWYKYNEFLESVFVIIVRRNLKADDINLRKIYSKVKIYEKNSKGIFVIDDFNIGISSSMIRNLIKNNQSVRYMVTDDVYDYIKKEKLYIYD